MYKLDLMINYRIFLHINDEIEFNTNIILREIHKEIKETNYKNMKN